MESWDDDNFEPPSVTVSSDVANTNKWAGEDEEDEVKESWEDEEEEKSQIVEEVKPKPKKLPLNERIAEKERLRREELERRLREQEDDMTPEEKMRMQQESDLKAALETTFGDSTNNTNFDGLNLPDSNADLQEFTDSLSKKLTSLSKNPEYPNFVEGLLRNLCATMSSIEIKKVKNTLDNLFLEKQKMEKGEKTKKNKGKGKAKLKMDDGNPLSAYVDDYNDYDDFM